MNRIQELKLEIATLRSQIEGAHEQHAKKVEALREAMLKAVMDCEELKEVRWQLRAIPGKPGTYLLESDGKLSEPKAILDLTDSPEDVIELGFCGLAFVKNRLHIFSADNSLKGVIALVQRLNYRVHPESLAQLRAQTEAIFDRLGALTLPKSEPMRQTVPPERTLDVQP